jgi:hypothetical protein
MYQPGAPNPAQGGFVIVVPREDGMPGNALWASHMTPAAIIDAFTHERRQYIGQLELLYAQAVYTSAPKTLKGRKVIHFIDNTSAVAGLVKGHSMVCDSAMIVNAFHAFNVHLNECAGVL